MLRRLALAVVLCLPALPAGTDSMPRVRVARGEVLVQQGSATRALAPALGEVELQRGPAALEAGAGTELDVSWRGLASARVAGPARLALTGEPRLRLARFQRLELEVRRGPLTLDAPGFFEAELTGGALSLAALAGGIEVLNRGGETLELQRAGARGSVRIPPGQRLRLRGN